MSFAARFNALPMRRFSELPCKDPVVARSLHHRAFRNRSSTAPDPVRACSTSPLAVAQHETGHLLVVVADVARDWRHRGILVPACGGKAAGKGAGGLASRLGDGWPAAAHVSVCSCFRLDSPPQLPARAYGTPVVGLGRTAGGCLAGRRLAVPQGAISARGQRRIEPLHRHGWISGTGTRACRRVDTGQRPVHRQECRCYIKVTTAARRLAERE